MPAKEEHSQFFHTGAHCQDLIFALHRQYRRYDGHRDRTGPQWGL